MKLAKLATTAIVLPFASTIVLILSIAMPAKAQTTFECGNSFVILPDGGCLNLTHLGYLGHSRENLANVQQNHQILFDANVELEILQNQYPAFVSETEQQRQDRYESLAESSNNRDDVAADAQQMEDLLFPLQNRAMTVFGSAFSGD